MTAERQPTVSIAANHAPAMDGCTCSAAQSEINTKRRVWILARALPICSPAFVLNGYQHCQCRPRKASLILGAAGVTGRLRLPVSPEHGGIPTRLSAPGYPSAIPPAQHFCQWLLQQNWSDTRN